MTIPSRLPSSVPARWLTIRAGATPSARIIGADDPLHASLGVANEMALQDAAVDREDPGGTLSRTFSQLYT